MTNISDSERDDNVGDLMDHLTDAEREAARQQELAELEAEDRQRLSDLFRECRHTLKLRQYDLGKILGVGDGQTISKWERGTQQIPGTAWLALIALLMADNQREFAEKILDGEIGPVSDYALSFFALRLGTDPPYGYKVVSANADDA